LEEVIGKALVDWESLSPGESGSGAEELVLHFTDGKEISIFRHDDGTIMVEGD
jgi:hypothetical protein